MKVGKISCELKNMRGFEERVREREREGGKREERKS